MDFAGLLSVSCRLTFWFCNVPLYIVEVWVSVLYSNLGYCAVTDVPFPDVVTVAPLYKPCQLEPPLMDGEVKYV